ncbi:MAG: hypothetical protein AAFQ41_11280 [Cyanobacteria bacterium J06623_7]
MSEIDFGKIESTEIFGYSPLDAGDLAQKIAAGSIPSELPGDFILVVEGQTSAQQSYVAVIVSAVCVLPYYIYHQRDRFIHGQNIFEVASKAQIDWQWNQDALRAILALGFCLDRDSLHQDIERAAPATIYYCCEGKLTTVTDSFPTDIFNPAVAYSDRDTLQIYNDVFDEYYDNREVCLSLSAGYDSRVFLASFLERGIKPPVGTEGSPDSIDVLTATEIAKDFGLEHRTLELTETDFVRHADQIITATSGEIPLSAAWGPYLFFRQVGFPSNAIHLAGTNGGFFKANYSNREIFYRLADLLPTPLLKQFFNAYLLYKKRPYQGFPLNKFNCFQQSSGSISDRCYQLAKKVPNFSNQVDYFHTFNRVRNYTGKGLALYNLINLTSSPFLDPRMVRAGARLAKKYKLNCGFHQQILLDSCPQLAEYPMNGKNISPSRSTKYAWLEQKAQQPQKGPNIRTKLLQNAELIAICDDSPHLDYFMARPDRQRAREQGIFAIFSFLVSMHYVSEKIAAL